MLNRLTAFLTVLFAVFLSALGSAQESQKPEAKKSLAASEKGELARPQSIDELLLFYPSKFPDGNWKPAGLRFEDVYFSADDGTKLHGWYCPCEAPRAVVLLMHGNGGNIASRAPWLRTLQNRAKLSVLIFDYRGYGRSEGVPTVAGVIADATAARKKLCELAKLKDSEMLLMGESLGGAIAIQLAASSAPRGLILQSTFSSLRDVADVHFPKLSWLVPRNKLNSAKKIEDYRGLLFQSHGTMDRTIPFTSGQKLFKAAHDPKQFVTVARANHNNWLTDAYLKAFDKFIDRVVAKKQ